MGIEIGRTKLSNNERVDFFKTLSGWLSAGHGRTSVAEAVANTCDAFSHDEYATMKPRMDIIKREVQGGQIQFFEALRMSQLGFRPQEISIIEAAEKSSQLRQAVPALVRAMEIQYNGRREMVMKLAGPLFIGVMLILMSLGVLLFMLPLVVEPVIERNAKALQKFPFILRWYWYASVWLRANPWVPVVVVLAPLVLFLLRNTTLLRPYYLRFLLGWSVSRKLILGFNSVIVVYFMPALVRSGLPTYRVLQYLADCVSNPTLSNAFRVAAQEHENGIRMSQALEIIPFRASFINAVAAGESTGAIADRVQDLQDPYSIELERNIKTVVGTLKFIVMAILLPFFIVSTYTALVGPIFALMEY
ncbi:MAG: type II secretion system F family protein [Pseudomonadaceae bacterium]|nr:type II secretion system F family protein [Pseudomonadaceae bacterium]